MRNEAGREREFWVAKEIERGGGGASEWVEKEAAEDWMSCRSH